MSLSTTIPKISHLLPRTRARTSRAARPSPKPDKGTFLAQVLGSLGWCYRWCGRALKPCPKRTIPPLQAASAFPSLCPGHGGLGSRQLHPERPAPRSRPLFGGVFPTILPQIFPARHPMGPADECLPESGVERLSLCHISALVSGQANKGAPLRTRYLRVLSKFDKCNLILRGWPM